MDDDADNFIDTFDTVLRNIVLVNAHDQGSDVSLFSYIISAG